MNEFGKNHQHLELFCRFIFHVAKLQTLSHPKKSIFKSYQNSYTKFHIIN